jgi:four helix bundle protein
MTQTPPPPTQLPRHKLIAFELCLSLVKLVAKTRIADAQLRARARNSAASAALNCAEGAARHTRADTSRAYGIALCECCETCAAAEIAGALGACTAAEVPAVVVLGARAKNILNRLMRGAPMALSVWLSVSGSDADFDGIERAARCDAGSRSPQLFGLADSFCSLWTSEGAQLSAGAPRAALGSFASSWGRVRRSARAGGCAAVRSRRHTGRWRMRRCRSDCERANAVIPSRIRRWGSRASRPAFTAVSSLSCTALCGMNFAVACFERIGRVFAGARRVAASETGSRN